MARRVRLISGLILFAYIVTHFVNHGLGIVSIAAMEAMLRVAYPIWSYPAVTFVLYGALVIHMTLAFYALWQRRLFKLSLHESVQYVLGFSVPVLLAEHVTNTRIDAAFYGGDFGHYKYLLSALWYGHPEKGVLQMVLLLAAWIHACIGLQFWLRVQPWYGDVQSLLFAAALLMPVLALLGYVAGGREIGVVLAQDPRYVARLLAAQPPPEARPALFAITWCIRFVFLGAIVILLVARMVRHEWWRRKGVARISYPDGRSIEVVRGFTVLETKQRHDAVTGEFVDPSSSRLYRLAHGPAIAVQQKDDVIGKLGLGDVREIADVRKENRDLPFTPFRVDQPPKSGAGSHGGGKQRRYLDGSMRTQLTR